jgi:hypothetical protein
VGKPQKRRERDGRVCVVKTGADVKLERVNVGLLYTYIVCSSGLQAILFFVMANFVFFKFDFLLSFFFFLFYFFFIFFIFFLIFYACLKLGE